MHFLSDGGTPAHFDVGYEVIVHGTLGSLSTSAVHATTTMISVCNIIGTCLVPVAGE